jgi:uncharacterized protein (DUF2126 family)
MSNLATHEPALHAAIAQHDDALANAGLSVWLGSEPTFTDRSSLAPQWLHQALGGDKEARAQQWVARLAARSLHAVLLRSVGRQYPGEALPRWSYGLYGRRDGTQLWHGPPDPLQQVACRDADEQTLRRFRDTLCEALRVRGWSASSFDISNDPRSWRIAARRDGQSPSADALNDAALCRPLCHHNCIPHEGLHDALARQGVYLFIVHGIPTPLSSAAQHAGVDLPAFDTVAEFSEGLAALSDASKAVALDHLILTGFPPPTDASVTWTTVTPDPAVIEVNMAPLPTLAQYHAAMCQLFDSAAQGGLHAERYYYNGHIVDSGGGGHITLGGASPQQSPFRLYPWLLPRLVSYFSRHPSLSYLFAVDHIGSASQSPRPDEGLRDAPRELQLALQLLTRETDLDLECAWATLAPFMTDYTGNTHRAEINIEKLANPYLPGRGQLGLVEFRALRMAPTPQWATAMAALLRSIVAMLCKQTVSLDLADWGEALHEQFALPFHLEQDFDCVLDDIATAGFALTDPLSRALCTDDHRHLADSEFAGYRIRLRRAIQLWPLMGDVAGQERGGSRLVDASTTRLELCIRSATASEDAAPLPLMAVQGYRLALRKERDRHGSALVAGVRYRSYQPQLGLHPTLAAQAPLQFKFVVPQRQNALLITLHEWHPDGTAYAGLPSDREDARTRIRERIVTKEITGVSPADFREPPAAACGSHFLDLRFCAP